MEGSEVIQKQLEVLKTVLMRLELLGTGFIKETRWSVDITIDFNKLRLSSNQRNWLNGICQATDQKKKKKKSRITQKKKFLADTDIHHPNIKWLRLSF